MAQQHVVIKGTVGNLKGKVPSCMTIGREVWEVALGSIAILHTAYPVESCLLSSNIVENHSDIRMDSKLYEFNTVLAHFMIEQKDIQFNPPLWFEITSSTRNLELYLLNPSTYDPITCQSTVSVLLYFRRRPK
jgi:hypothetical protein